MTTRGDAVIVDVDGTLCDTSTILYHLLPSLPGWKGYKDMEGFHKASAWCPAIAATVAEVRKHREAGRGILIMTARHEKWKALTVGWLEGVVEWDEIYMRGDTDDRPAPVVKADLLQKVRARGWNPVHAIDDDPSVIKMWTMHGIPTTTVPGWIE